MSVQRVGVAGVGPWLPLVEATGLFARDGRIMSNLDAQQWRTMLDYLRVRHATICRQWFEHLKPMGMASGMLQIHTPTPIQQQYLQSKCREQFNEAAQAATGALVAVQFIHHDQDHHSGSGSARSNGTSTDGSTTHASTNPAASPPATSPTGSESGHLANGTDPSLDSSPTKGFTGHGHGGSDHPGASQGDPSWDPPASQTSRLRLVSDPYAAATQQSPRLGRAGTSGRPLQLAEQIVLSPDYSFDNFITGPNNRLAHAAAVAVANQPGTAYNPLFIHGGVGLGKTHLLQAICQTVMTEQRDLRIYYVSCETFINQFLECVQSGQMSEFRQLYRLVDLLVIDDIHFLANRERTQEEFFHTFNELYQQKKQIVLSSDSPPSEIPDLEERLVSRFQWGLVANVSKPDLETRVAIIRAKARLRGIELPQEVISLIATKIDTNARELEGALTTVQGYAALQDRDITIGLAHEALGDPSHESRSSQVTLQHIIDTVTDFYSVKLSDLQSRRRHKSVTGPRQVCMWLARKETRFSLEEIGGYFGGRDHTTVMHSIRTVEDRIDQEPTFAREVRMLDQKLEQHA